MSQVSAGGVGWESPTPNDSFVGSTATLEVANPGTVVYRLSAQWTEGGKPNSRKSSVSHALRQVSVAVKYAHRRSAV
jgi:hypothetical protein